VSVEVRSEPKRGARLARLLRARAQSFLEALGRPGADLSLYLVGDAAMRRLNRTFRGQDRATDVLSFPQARAGKLLGDVALSLDTAERRARAAGRAVKDELDRYLAHGILHLLGHDHHRPGEARRMAAAEAALIGEGLVAPPGDGVEPARARRKRAARTRGSAR